MMNDVAEGSILANLTVQELMQAALAANEGVMADNGAFAVTTGKRTGRSPKDRYIVQDSITHTTVDWGEVNQPISAEQCQQLWDKAVAHMAQKQCYQGTYNVGAHADYAIQVSVTTEFAWHQLFVSNMFRSPASQSSIDAPWQILNAASLTTDPSHDAVNGDGVVIIDFTHRRVLLIGMHYGGEMKKAMFTVLNYLLPSKQVLPMHCAANADVDGGDVVLYFGLSGTGKTTLSSDPARYLIGDDEHGWSADATFNFEGGCYAKCYQLSAKNEPVIYDAIRPGAVLENVVLTETGIPDYSDDRYSQNGRVSYPLQHVAKRIVSAQGSAPKAVIFLCCDCYGVLPAVSVLTPEQAAYYFLSGYTAKVGSTEVGSTTGISATFSTCFGAPFFPRPAAVYADLLMQRVNAGCPVYLVNTGWSGGAYAAGGERFAIPVTRQIVSAITADDIEPGDVLPGFNLRLAQRVANIDATCLDPRLAWQDKQAYQQTAAKLTEQFQQNFKRFDVDAAITAAGPVAVDSYFSS